MSSTVPKLIIPLIRPLLPYLPLLPKPILTLLPSVFLHYTSHPKLAFSAYLQDPFTHPLHPPLLLTFFLIPLIYLLGLISGNVSWVDRSWPFFTPVCSGLMLLWAGMNDNGGLYGHNLPRLSVMMFLQVRSLREIFPGLVSKQHLIDASCSDESSFGQLAYSRTQSVATFMISPRKTTATLSSESSFRDGFSPSCTSW